MASEATSYMISRCSNILPARTNHHTNCATYCGAGIITHDWRSCFQWHVLPLSRACFCPPPPPPQLPKNERERKEKKRNQSICWNICISFFVTHSCKTAIFTYWLLYLYPQKMSKIQWKKWNTCQQVACECHKENHISAMQWIQPPTNGKMCKLGR